MTRIQPSLTEVETQVVDQMAQMTQTKRIDVIRNALAAYQWLVRQAATGASVVARKPSGEEVILETPELAALESGGNLMSPDDLGSLATQLAHTSDPFEAARLKERLTRGFYGI